MPTYEYECKSCGHRFERFQRISEKPMKSCPSCGKDVKRLLGTGGGFIFKGSGFYATDYRSKSYKKGADKEKKAADGGEGKGSPCSGCDSKDCGLKKE